MADGFDVNSVLGALQGAQSAQVTSLVSQTALSQEREQATAAQVNDLGQLSQAQSQVAESKAKAQQSLEQVNLGIAQRFGVDPRAAGWKLGKLADEVNTASDQMRDASERIRQKQSVNFIQNPLQALINSFTIQSDIADYNAADRTSSLASQQSKQLSTLLDEGAKANLTTLQTISQADIDNGKFIAGAQARKEMQAAQIDGMRWRRQDIMDVAAANKEIAGLSMSGFNALQTEAARRMQAQGLDISRAHLALAQQEAAQRAAIKEHANGDKAFMEQIVATGYLALTGEIPDKDKIAMFSGPASKTEQAKAYISAGLASFQRSPDGTRLSIASSPYDAADIAAKGLARLNSPGTQGMQQTLNKLKEWRAVYENDPKEQLKFAGITDAATRRSAIEAGFNGWAQAQADLLVKDPIFGPAKFATVAAKSPSFQQSKLWTAVLSPAQAGGVDVDRPEVAMPLVINNIVSGKISMEEAQTLQQFYARGVELGNLSHNWESVGMRGPTKYPVGTVNYADAKEFARELNLQLRSAKINNMMGGNRTLGFN